MAEMTESKGLTERIPRGGDLEVRVRVLQADGEEFLDIREYIPSADTYGRGVTMPYELRQQVIAALKRL